MESNIGELDFVSDEVELYELAKLVNIANKREVIGKKLLKE